MPENGDERMSDLTVQAEERGAVRVFAIDLDRAAARDWMAPGPEGRWPLAGALGVERLDPADVQVFAARDVAEIGLATYLATGFDIPEDALAPDRGRLDAETGLIAVIRSPAFAAPVTLDPRPPLRFLGRWQEPGPGALPGRVDAVESARPGTGTAGPDEREPEPEPEDDAGRVIERFAPDRETYIRDHLIQAALGMVVATVVLYLLGTAEPWIGVIAALLAIAVRGAYLASEELGQRYALTERYVVGPFDRRVALTDIAQVRKLGSAVQVVTRGGDKMLLKFQADPARVKARIADAAGVER